MGSTRSFGEGERRLHGLEDLPHIQHVNTIAIRSNRHSAKYGYGIRLSFQFETKSSSAKFKIYKWTGPIASGSGAQIGGGPGPIYSGDTVYLQAMGVNHYVEVHGHDEPGGGYGVSTVPCTRGATEA